MLTLIAFWAGYLDPNRCIGYSPAYRFGSESCWVQYDLGQRQKICIDHRTWIQWLNSPFPDSICIHHEGPWRSYASLQNSVHSHPIKKNTFVQSKPKIQRPQSRSPTLYLQRAIEHLREKTSELLATQDPFGLLRSLFLDEGSSNGPLPMLRRLGFVHLISTSGIHLYAWISTWDKLIQALTLSKNVTVSFGLKISRITSGFGCFILWLLTGFRLGLLRAGLIVMAREASKTLGFRWGKGSPLILALALDGLIGFIKNFRDPDSQWISGRGYYALAVGGGLLWHPCFRSVHLGLAIGSWIGVGLWEIWETGMIALATPILSLITLPMVCLWIYPLMIFAILFDWMGLTPIAQELIQALARPLNTSLIGLTRIAMLPGNIWLVPRSALILGFILSTTLLLSYPRLFFEKIGKKEWQSSLLLVSSLIVVRLSWNFYLNSRPNPSFAFQVEQLDVGQGDSAWIRSNNNGLIDTGSQRALSDTAWMTLLAQRQIRTLSWTALTHLDEDHSGGLLRLARLLPISCVSTPTHERKSQRGIKYAKQLEKFGIPLENLDSGCVPFPTLETTSRKSQNKNMGAVYVPLQGGGFYLSSGDAGAEEEVHIGNWADSFTEAFAQIDAPRILKLNHHGSKNSNSARFLRKVRPTEAWLSSGRNNRYGHPAVSVLKTLRELNIPLRRTDFEGAISLDLPVLKQ